MSHTHDVDFNRDLHLLTAHSYSGQGEATFRSGNTYSGQFCRGVMDGRGRYTWISDGTTYEGDLRYVNIIEDREHDPSFVALIRTSYMYNCIRCNSNGD